MGDGALDGVAVGFAARCSPFSDTLVSKVQGSAPSWVLSQWFVTGPLTPLAPHSIDTLCITGGHSPRVVQCLPCTHRGQPQGLCHDVVCDCNQTTVEPSLALKCVHMHAFFNCCATFTSRPSHAVTSNRAAIFGAPFASFRCPLAISDLSEHWYT